MANIIFIIVMSIISISILIQDSNQQSNNCDRKAVDHCMLEMTIIGDPKQRFPIDLDTMNERCRQMKRLEKCVRNFAQNCLQSDSQLSKIINTFTRSLHGVRYYPEKNLRIPLLCCNYFLFKRSILNVIDENCLQTHDEVEHLIDGYGNDLVNFICNDYTEDSDKCGTIIDQTPKWNKPLNYTSFIIPIAEIVNNL
ncbi:uncharacterized protein LOC113798716 isoform X2 [Dermatophagoides pteronyssinus]|uniref:Uncharacterized protein LOC113798716 isoform X2 n=1 Tax=Dermatophagoides pteronyssinus TaxID=6956 RepID=A0A6P6YII6_DERPT|nr:uncharacterized protein LOC113798716 isoform X2 [Dermatophagoides pteronyssinus]